MSYTYNTIHIMIHDTTYLEQILIHIMIHVYFIRMTVSSLG